MSDVARIFLRKTNCTPTDNMAFIGRPPLNIETKEIHISVVFTYDIPEAEEIYKFCEKIAPTKIGGPAFNLPSGEFIPGMYVEHGYTITSRGCPNRCWFCSVWKREPRLIELPIHNGYNVLDDNLLACSEDHIRKVFAMLKTQKPNPIEFTGGLEAKRLKPWHVDLLWDIRPKQIFFAYDTLDDLEPLVCAGKILHYANFTRNSLRCYVLDGYPGDTLLKAEKRMYEAWVAGFMPMSMLWKNENGDINEEWREFHRLWSRPAAIKSMIKMNFRKIIS